MERLRGEKFLGSDLSIRLSGPLCGVAVNLNGLFLFFYFLRFNQV